MKIAFDYQIFQAQRFGGISRYFFELASQLAELENDNLDCRVISPFYINDYLHHSSKKLKISGVAVPVIPKSGRIYRSINRLLSPIIFRGWQPDIVHETFYSTRSVAPTGSRVVITVYDMITELYPENVSSKNRVNKVKKSAVDRADHVICISENTRKDLIRLFGVPPEKTTVVYLGFALTQSDSKILPQISRPFMLYVGARGGYKNFERLLVSYASNSELRNNYDILAFGGGSLKSHELELIKSLNVPLQNVRQISGDDGVLAALYKKASIFVYPSLYEGFGIPPLEAMSFNCPVACSNTSSIPEVVGDAAVQFDPLDTDSITEALLNLSSDSALRSKIVGLGKNRLENFSWEKCAMQTLDVYRNLI